MGRSTLTSGSFLLDTNIVIAFLEDDIQVHAELNQASEIFVPVVAIGELYFGAAKSGRPGQNAARIDQFVEDRSILYIDSAVARQYGTLKNNLRRKGRPIPENDMWIAAIALERGLTLVTRDAHFGAIDDLLIASWSTPT